MTKVKKTNNKIKETNKKKLTKKEKEALLKATENENNTTEEQQEDQETSDEVMEEDVQQESQDDDNVVQLPSTYQAQDNDSKMVFRGVDEQATEDEVVKRIHKEIEDIKDFKSCVEWLMKNQHPQDSQYNTLLSPYNKSRAQATLLSTVLELFVAKKWLSFRELGGNVKQTLPILNQDVIANLVRKHGGGSNEEKFYLTWKPFGKEILICSKIFDKERELKRISLNERQIFQNKPTYIEIEQDRDGVKLEITLKCLSVMKDGKTNLFINRLYYNMVRDFEFCAKFTSKRMIEDQAGFGICQNDEPVDI